MSKQTNRSKLSYQLPPINQKNIDNTSTQGTEELLQVGGVKINVRKLEQYGPQPKSTLTSARKKSHKSLGTNISDNRSLRAFKTRERKKGFSTQNVPKAQAKEQLQTLQLGKSIIKREESLQSELQVKPEKEEKEPQFHFKEKKMKIGKKIKTDLMKQFIMETLAKGRAQSNCLTIHKGTAQCNYSPIKQQKQVQNKEKYPLKLVQQPSERRLANRGPIQRGLPPRNRPVRPKQQGGPVTSVRLPSLNQNNKWVNMARKMQKAPKTEEEIKEEIEGEKPQEEKQEVEIIAEEIQK